MRFMMMIKCTKDSEAGLPPSPLLMAGMGKLTEEMTRGGSCLLPMGFSRARKVCACDSPVASAR